MKASGAAAPNDCAISAGNAKMLAPMVVLIMLAARPGTPIARSSWASAFCVFSGGDIAPQWPLPSRETSLLCGHARQLSRRLSFVPPVRQRVHRRPIQGQGKRLRRVVGEEAANH